MSEVTNRNHQPQVVTSCDELKAVARRLRPSKPARIPVTRITVGVDVAGATLIRKRGTVTLNAGFWKEICRSLNAYYDRKYDFQQPLDWRDLRFTFVDMPQETASKAEGVDAWRAAWSRLATKPDCLCFHVHGNKALVVRSDKWQLGASAAMDYLLPLSNAKPLELQAEKVFTRFSAPMTGNAICGRKHLPRTKVVDRETEKRHMTEAIVSALRSRGLDPDLWLEKCHDGMIWFSQTWCLAVFGVLLPEGTVLRTVRIFIPGVGVAKGNGCVVKADRLPEGFDVVVPRPSLTMDFLPRFSWLHIQGFGKETTFTTDPQVMCHFPEIGRYFPVWVDNYTQMAKEALKGKIPELLAQSLNALAESAEEDSEDEDPTSTRDVVETLGEKALAYKGVRTDIINDVVGGGMSRHALDAGNVLVPREVARTGYIMPDYTGLNPETGLIDPTKCELPQGALKVDSATGTVTINPWNLINWLGIWGGADFDDQVNLFASGDKFFGFRRPVGHPGQAVTGTIIGWGFESPIAADIVERIASPTRWVPKNLESGENWLKQFYQVPSLTAPVRYGWKEVHEQLLKISEGRYALGVGSWAKLSSKAIAFMREWARWMDTGMSDVKVAVKTEPGVAPNERAQLLTLDKVLVTVSRWDKELGAYKDVQISLRELLLNMRKKADVLRALLLVDERLIDLVNGKPKFPKTADGQWAAVLDVVEAFNKIRNLLGDLQRVSPELTWFSAKPDVNRMRIAPVDEPYNGSFPKGMLKKGVWVGGKPIQEAQFKYDLPYTNWITSSIASRLNELHAEAQDEGEKSSLVFLITKDDDKDVPKGRPNVSRVIRKAIAWLEKAKSAKRLKSALAALYTAVYGNSYFEDAQPRVMRSNPYVNGKTKVAADWLTPWTWEQIKSNPNWREERACMEGSLLIGERRMSEMRRSLWDQRTTIPSLNVKSLVSHKRMAEKLVAEYAIASLKDTWVNIVTQTKVQKEVVDSTESVRNAYEQLVSLIGGVDCEGEALTQAEAMVNAMATQNGLTDSLIWTGDYAERLAALVVRHGGDPIQPSTPDGEDRQSSSRVVLPRRSIREFVAAWRSSHPESASTPAEKELPKFVMMIGVPSSGKTTKAIAMAEKGYTRVSVDDIRTEEERQAKNYMPALKRAMVQVVDLLKSGKNVVFDATNTVAGQRRERLEMVRQLASCYACVMEVSEDTAMKREFARGRGAACVNMIRDMFSKGAYSAEWYADVVSDGWTSVHRVRM